MKVYWDRGFGDKGNIAGEEKSIDWTFHFDDCKYYLPSIYRFPQGIIFDIIGIFNSDEVKAFTDKYQDLEEGQLDEAEQRLLAQNHPLKSFPFSRLKINDEPLEGNSSAFGSSHIPWRITQDWHSDITKYYIEKYGEDCCFNWFRYQMEYPPETSPKVFAEEIHSIEMITNEVPHFVPINLSFLLPCDFTGIYRESFCHPETGTKYNLYFQNLEHEELAYPQEDRTVPIFISSLLYEIEPELPDGTILEFDSSLVDDNQTEGWTMFFVSGLNSKDGQPGANGFPCHSCLATSSFRKRDNISVILKGLESKRIGVERLFWQNPK